MASQKNLIMLGSLLIFLGSLLGHLIQTAGDVSIKDLRFTGSNGQTLSGLLYVPPGATAETPAPGVLAVHGYINSREVQAGFAIELARRGYVVLALDQSGHGYSDGPAFSNGFGGPAALAYLRSLDIVDNNNIGLEGHSMGGWTILAAAAAMPDAYKSIVLQGSSTGSGFSAPGTADWPRNVAVVFAQYDEFSPLMWEVERGSQAADSAKLQTLFGTDQRIEQGRLYGNIAQGTARIFHNPPVTHPGNHLSHQSIRHTIDWFDRTLEGGRSAVGQIWFFKELGTLTAFIGLVILLCGVMTALLNTTAFTGLRALPQGNAWPERSARWWGAAVLSAIIPVATFYPLFSLAGNWLPANSWLPQLISNQLIVWAVVNGLLLSGLGLVIKTDKVAFQQIPLIKSALLAVLVVSAGYLTLLLADFFFKVDFRFWFVGLKLLNLTQFQIALVYLPPLFVFFVLAGRALHGGMSVAGDSVTRQYLSNAAIMAGGFLIFLLLQYGSLFLRGVLLTPAEPLNTIVMIQFVPLLLIVSVISTCAWRHTGSYLPGALINALFVAWYLVAGQATQAVW
ncbi:alpha/beta hydrolase family protein [Pseudohongiella spirulinae]|uniref:AB hydrolase-1 domain-containing protein n=1 Tax=Pseudohongiella spirulinae TaxID=1249552 RepID=A0A0S2KBU8_9GAMM|nr:alpha/beta fold hydrolase [Pseudohongiella spirulinae]ALO45614.1 hypothetical protein PS2015_944 [Pseudohongiella spirulinae]